MNQTITKIYEPFPHLQIDNMYNDDELELILEELKFLNYKEKLENPEETGSALDEDNNTLKVNKGLFLDDLYKKREISNILTVNRKIFNNEYLEAYASLCFGYKSILKCNSDSTLISYYENGGYYHSHQDTALYTALTWFFKVPKAFEGGNLIFSEFNEKKEIQNNTTVIFPSWVLHSVEEIKMNENCSPGLGRYCMSQFMYIVS